MPEQFKTRQQRREEAREVAKLLMQHGPREKFRWDYTLTCVLGALGIGVVMLPPQSPIVAGLWLAAMFAVGIYPALHLAEWALPIRRKWIASCIGIVALAFAMGIFAKIVWPVPRYKLSPEQYTKFVSVLRSQREPRSKVKIGCASSSEQLCLYAEQFFEAFEEVDWKIEGNKVERLSLPRPRAGILVFYGAAGNTPPDRHSGFWIAVTPTLRTIKNGFKAINLKYQIQMDYSAPPDVVGIAFYPDND